MQCGLRCLFIIAVCARAAMSADATAIIESKSFPNLQAALDAIPAAGGELRIAPGTYEITEPLRLHRGDVRIVGAGTATHIVNKNESGKSAWILSPSEEELRPTEGSWITDSTLLI